MRGTAWELLTVHPHDAAHWGALRAALGLAVPALLLLTTGNLEHALPVTFGALAGVYGRHARYRARLRVQAGAGALLVGCVAAGTSAAALGVAALALLVPALASGAGFLAARRGGWLPPGSLFATFAAGACAAHPRSWADVGAAVALSAAAAAFALLLGQAGALLPAGRRRPKRDVPAGPSVGEQVRDPAARGDLLAHVLAPLLAGALATAAGGGHPYWAMVAAVAPLSVAGARDRLARSVHRVLGTLGGVALAFALLSLEPSPLVTIVLAALFQAWAELLVTRHYALAVVGITPLALLMVHLAVPVDPGSVAADRAVQTVLGSAVAVALVLLAPRGSAPARR
ncbi:FUSC family protein [Paenibacillus sp. TRM 82003]|uniref:FUSC family protein n=1 Tax=Kineococcus sp. TRM81007 TaxID=2925831 RepID=UPI001F593EAC|nr:FUSC family protein [Kineococcus sp. TRM81007]MCI2239045.1 FUSC family protein [Kineococcus sp. TRM81007]MCI3924465.1 FUSC family protein [Paenibacillus sp. TRM 82003]